MAHQTIQAQCPPAPILRRKGFQLTGRDFHPSPANIARVEGSRLRELFHPKGLYLQGDQRGFTKKPFLVAQLRWYGIPFRTSDRIFDLENTLKEAVDDSKCDELPQFVGQLERTMRIEHDPAVRAWDLAVKNWNAEQKVQRDLAWSRCATPADRAKHDPERFIAHYFLTDGRPDPAKTPKPMALRGLNDTWGLRQAADRVEGLKTRSGGTGKMRTICIGWSHAELSRLTSQIDRESQRREKEAADQLSSAAMQQHQRLVRQVQKKGFQNKSSRNGPIFLQKIRGSYVVRCERVASEWPPTSLFTLDIGLGVSPSIAAGHLDLGYFEGTMLLALDDATLDIYTLENETEENGWEEGDSEPDRRAGSKRKRAASDAQPVQNKASVGHPSEKQKDPSHQIFIRLRGRETGEGEIQPEPILGRLEFSDDHYTKFEAEIQLPYLSGVVKMEGFKVSTKEKRECDPWSRYSEVAYENALAGRWG